MCERRENYGTVYTQEKKKYIESSTIERERERESSFIFFMTLVLNGVKGEVGHEIRKGPIRRMKRNNPHWIMPVVVV